MNLKIRRRKATVNLIMALASCLEARSPTELSESPLYQYEYSSISKAMADLAHNSEERSQIQSLFRQFCFSHFASESLSDQTRLILQTDTTSIIKAHSPTLLNRTHVPIPNNKIKGNKPIDIGYEASFINLSMPEGKWSLPLDIDRVRSDETASQRALAQLQVLLSQTELGLSNYLCLNTLDSKYGNAAYLASAFEHDNLVNLTRFRAGMKVWTKADESNDIGAPKVFGEKYYLNFESKYKTYKHPKTKLAHQVYQRSIFELPTNNYLVREGKTKSGRAVCIHIWRWNELLIRSKNGNNMKDKPFDLIAVQLKDARTGKVIFKRPMFIAINGKRKDEIQSKEGYQTYRKRYDIEPFMRFSKQHLMLDKFQTPDIEHLDNWLLLNQPVMWLLWSAAKEADFKPKKWRQYLPENKDTENQPILSPTQTRRAVEKLFLTFDLTPFKPQKSKKGRPRQKGEKQSQRTRYKVVKKTTSKTKIKLKSEKIE
ncbi:MAG: transposase [Bacteroidota bacterium]